MEQRLRVALTLEQCWHRVPGGTAVAAIGMANALDRDGSLDIIGVAARHKDAPGAEWTPPVAVRHLPLPRVALYEAWHRLRRPAVQRATGDVDVIHATTIAVPPRTAPLVVTIHDLAFLRDPSHFTARGLSFFKRGLSLAKRDAHAIHCPSEATARDCVTAGVDEAKIHVVPLGIETAPVTDTDVEAAKERHHLVRPYVLWSGTIEPRKNLSGLLTAWGALDEDVDLVLVGPRGWNEDLNALTARARRKPRVLGFVARSELNALYAGAAVVCWPSMREGFGFPVLEAMAQGAPVVTSTGTSTEEIAGDAALLVDPKDPAAIADAIRRLLSDEPLARKLSDAGRARAAEFTWDRTAIGLRDVYRGLKGMA
ncbi:MAG: glycosyltransferase family 4 protein [Actinomycetota bacterium]